MRTAYAISDSQTTASKVVEILIKESVWFQCDPLPFDKVGITVKQESYPMGVLEENGLTVVASIL